MGHILEEFVHTKVRAYSQYKTFMGYKRVYIRIYISIGYPPFFANSLSSSLSFSLCVLAIYSVYIYLYICATIFTSLFLSFSRLLIAAVATAAARQGVYGMSPPTSSSIFWNNASIQPAYSNGRLAHVKIRAADRRDTEHYKYTWKVTIYINI